jgi:hypothetical protein
MGCDRSERSVRIRGQAVFSVPGFVDEEVFRGNGMITVRFDAGGRMWVTEKQGRILMAAPNTNATASFTYEYYEKPAAAPNWTTMPNFSNTAQVTFVKSGQQASFSIEPKEVNDYFAFRFSGQIDLPTTGTYTFYLTSDDGSLLYIDGNLVVNHNGLHGNSEMSGSAVLTAGVHAIVVEFFEAGGGEALTVQYAGPFDSERARYPPDRSRPRWWWPISVRRWTPTAKPA